MGMIRVVSGVNVALAWRDTIDQAKADLLASRMAALVHCIYLPPLRDYRRAAPALTNGDLDGAEWHGCSSGTSTQPVVREMLLRLVAEVRRLRDVAARAVEIGVDAALGEVSRQQGGIVEPVATEARGAGIAAGCGVISPASSAAGKGGA